MTQHRDSCKVTDTVQIEVSDKIIFTLNLINDNIIVRVSLRIVLTKKSNLSGRL